jgi:hypothetical protein
MMTGKGNNWVYALINAGKSFLGVSERGTIYPKAAKLLFFLQPEKAQATFVCCSDKTSMSLRHRHVNMKKG